MPLFSLWLSLSAFAVPPAPALKFSVDAPPPVSDAMCYGSGLKVVAVHRPGTGLATSTLIVDAGRNAEKSGQVGAAHLVEHLWFQSLPKSDITVQERLAGLRVSAGTYTDVTAFTIGGIPEDIGAIVNLQAQLLIAPLAGITEKTFANEQQVVLREHWYRGEHSYRAVQRALDFASYPESHPYHSSTSTAEDVEADLSIDDLFAKLEAALPREVLAGNGTPCREVSKPQVPAKPFKTDILVVQGAVLNNELNVAWTAPPAWDVTDAMWEELTRRLRSSVYRRLDSVTGLKSHAAEFNVGCRHWSSALATTVSCSIGVPEGVPPQELHRQVLAAAADVVVPDAKRDFDLGQSAYPRVRQAIGTLASPSLDVSMQRARYMHFSGDPYPFATRLESLRIMTDGSLAALAAKWLKSERMVSVWLTQAPTPTSVGADLKPTVSLEVAAPTEWNTPKGVGDRLTEHRLTNGMPVWLVHTPFAPLVDVELVFDAGWVRAPESGTNEVLSYILQYEVILDPGAIRAGTSQTTDWIFEDWFNGFYAGNVSSNLKMALWEPRMTTEKMILDFATRQNTLDQYLRTAFDDFTQWPFSISASLRRKHLYGEATLALPWWERNKAARYVRESVVRGWTSQTMRPDRAHAIVASDLPIQEMLPVIEKSYGKWKGRGKLEDPITTHGMASPDVLPKLFTIDANLPLSDVRYTCRLPGRTTETAAALDVLEHAVHLGLFQSLRGQGASYGPSASILTWSPLVSELTLEADIAPTDANAAIKLMEGVVTELQKNVPDGLLATAKLKAQHDHVVAFASSFRAVSYLDHTAPLGIPLAKLQQWPAEIDKVTAAQVSALLEPCVGHHAATIVGRNASEIAAKGGLNPESVDLQSTGRHIVDDLQ